MVEENEFEPSEPAKTVVEAFGKRSNGTKEGIAKAKAAGTYRGGRPRTCSKCGWSHSVDKPCREPRNEKYFAKVHTPNATAPVEDQKSESPGSMAAGTENVK